VDLTTETDSITSETANLDRRKTIKMGALAGAAGLVAASGLNGVRLTSSATTKTTHPLSPNMTDLLADLIHQGLLKPFSTVRSFYIPAHSSVRINQSSPHEHVSLISENRLVVGRDHTLQLSLSIDGKHVLYDPDMVQERYNGSLSFLSGSTFYPIKSKWEMHVKNTISRRVYFSSMEVGGHMLTTDWEKIAFPLVVAGKK
jgi:hypothetical protein